MKNILLIFMFITVSLLIKAQDYESCFGSESTKMNIVSTSVDRSSNNTVEFTMSYSDTIRFNNLLFFNAYDYLAQSDEHDMLFRLNYNTNGQHTIDTIMNLNLSVGDSIFVKSPGNYVYNESIDRGIAHVISKYETNGRTIIEFDAIIDISDSVQVPLRFIEGVGANFGISFNAEYTSPMLILCYKKNDTLSYIDQVINSCEYSASGPLDLTELNKNNSNAAIVTFENGLMNITCRTQGDYFIQLTSFNGTVLGKKSIIRGTHTAMAIQDNVKVFILTILDSKGILVENRKILHLKS